MNGEYWRENTDSVLFIYRKYTFKFKIRNLKSESRGRERKTMASSSDMKGFFRQKKKTTVGRGVGKSKANKAASFKKSKNSAFVGTDQVQPPALISHGALDLQG